MSRELVSCPSCGSTMVLRSTAKHRYPNGQNKLFFGCSRYPSCRTTLSANPDGTPVDSPSISLLESRSLVYSMLSKLWKTDRMTKNEAHLLLAEALGIPFGDARVNSFDEDTCSRAIDILSREV